MIPIPNTQLSVGKTKIGRRQRYFAAGPVEGQWWTRDSWWVIPLGVVSILLLGLTAAGCLSRREVIRPILVPAPVSSHSSITPAPTTERGTTIEEAEEVMGKVGRIISAVDRLRGQTPVQPTPAPRPQVEAPPAAPAPPEMTDIQRRNEALKERLRQRYGDK